MHKNSYLKHTFPTPAVREYVLVDFGSKETLEVQLLKINTPGIPAGDSCRAMDHIMRNTRLYFPNYHALYQKCLNVRFKIKYYFKKLNKTKPHLLKGSKLRSSGKS